MHLLFILICLVGKLSSHQYHPDHQTPEASRHAIEKYVNGYYISLGRHLPVLVNDANSAFTGIENVNKHTKFHHDRYSNVVNDRVHYDNHQYGKINKGSAISPTHQSRIYQDPYVMEGSDIEVYGHGRIHVRPSTEEDTISQSGIHHVDIDVDEVGLDYIDSKVHSETSFPYRKKITRGNRFVVSPAISGSRNNPSNGFNQITNGDYQEALLESPGINQVVYRENPLIKKGSTSMVGNTNSFTSEIDYEGNSRPISLNFNRGYSTQSGTTNFIRYPEHGKKRRINYMTTTGTTNHYPRNPKQDSFPQKKYTAVFEANPETISTHQTGYTNSLLDGNTHVDDQNQYQATGYGAHTNYDEIDNADIDISNQNIYVDYGVSNGINQNQNFGETGMSKINQGGRNIQKQPNKSIGLYPEVGESKQYVRTRNQKRYRNGIGHECPPEHNKVNRERSTYPAQTAPGVKQVQEGTEPAKLFVSSKVNAEAAVPKEVTLNPVVEENIREIFRKPPQLGTDVMNSHPTNIELKKTYPVLKKVVPTNYDSVENNYPVQYENPSKQKHFENYSQYGAPVNTNDETPDENSSLSETGLRKPIETIPRRSVSTQGTGTNNPDTTVNTNPVDTEYRKTQSSIYTINNNGYYPWMTFDGRVPVSVQIPINGFVPLQTVSYTPYATRLPSNYRYPSRKVNTQYLSQARFSGRYPFHLQQSRFRSRYPSIYRLKGADRPQLFLSTRFKDDESNEDESVTLVEPEVIVINDEFTDAEVAGDDDSELENEIDEVKPISPNNPVIDIPNAQNELVSDIVNNLVDNSTEVNEISVENNSPEVPQGSGEPNKDLEEVSESHRNVDSHGIPAGVGPNSTIMKLQTEEITQVEDPRTIRFTIKLPPKMVATETITDLVKNVMEQHLAAGGNLSHQEPGVENGIQMKIGGSSVEINQKGGESRVIDLPSRSAFDKSSEPIEVDLTTGNSSNPLVNQVIGSSEPDIQKEPLLTNGQIELTSAGQIPSEHAHESVIIHEINGSEKAINNRTNVDRDVLSNKQEKQSHREQELLSGTNQVPALKSTSTEIDKGSNEFNKATGSNKANQSTSVEYINEQDEPAEYRGIYSRRSFHDPHEDGTKHHHFHHIRNIARQIF